jgi:hypothetical protein
MSVTMGATDGEGTTESVGGDGDGDDGGRRGRDGGRGVERGELVAVKQSLLSLAQETVNAIKQLKTQMISLKKAVCCGGHAQKAPVQVYR